MGKLQYEHTPQNNENKTPAKARLWDTEADFEVSDSYYSDDNPFRSLYTELEVRGLNAITYYGSRADSEILSYLVTWRNFRLQAAVPCGEGDICFVLIHRDFLGLST